MSQSITGVTIWLGKATTLKGTVYFEGFFSGTFTISSFLQFICLLLIKVISPTCTLHFLQEYQVTMKSLHF